MISWTWYKFEELTLDILYNILALRQEIFIIEQRSLYHDIDYKDQQALHLVGIKNDKLIAYLRFLPKGVAYPNEANIGRITVAPNNRGAGQGRIMMKKLLDYFDKHYPNDTILIKAEMYLKAFYEDFGFQSDGAAYDEEDIMHINMRR